MRIPGKFSSTWFFDTNPQGKNTATKLLINTAILPLPEREREEKHIPTTLGGSKIYKGDLSHLYFIFGLHKSPHSVIISFAKGTSKDMIR